MEYKLELSRHQISMLEILIWRAWVELKLEGDDAAEQLKQILDAVRSAKAIKK